MKKSFVTGLFILLFGAIIIVQIFYDAEKKRSLFSEPLVLKPEIIRAADLGLHNAASDLLWLSAIQYFGGGESKTSEKLNDYLIASTELDKNFAYPYAFGVLVLPSIGQADQGIALAQKGIANNVKDWRIPYYLATTYYIDKNDAINAAKYFDMAANTAGAPADIQKVAANFGSRTDQREKTKQIWIGIYESSNDEVVKERAKNYIIHIEIMDLLEQAAKQYYTINGKYPTDLNQLVEAKILKAIPPDPFGFSFTINQSGKVEVK